MRSEAQPGFCYEGRGLNQKFYFFEQKEFILGPVRNKLMLLKRITKICGAELQALSDFCNLAVKNSDFNAILITFCTFLNPYE